MTNDKKPRDGKFYQIHNDLHLILKTPYEFVVLCKLIQHSNEDGYCFPAQELLEQGLMKRTSVYRSTKVLEKNGYIEIEHHATSRKINLSYMVNFPKIYNDIELEQQRIKELKQEHVSQKHVIETPTTNLPVETNKEYLSRFPKTPDKAIVFPTEQNTFPQETQHVSQTPNNHINVTKASNQINNNNQSNAFSTSFKDLKTGITGDETTVNVSLKVGNDGNGTMTLEDKINQDKLIQKMIVDFQKYCSSDINVSKEYTLFKATSQFEALPRKDEATIRPIFSQWCSNAVRKIGTTK